MWNRNRPWWRPPIRNSQLFLLVGAILLAALVGSLLWSSRRGASPAGSAEMIRDDSGARRATALASVVIVERDAPRLAQVAAIPSSIILIPGETTIFTAAAFDQNGRDLSQASFSWQMVDPVAGTITPGGIFRASFIEGRYPRAVVVVAGPPAGLGTGSAQGSVHVTIRREATGSSPASILLFPKVAKAEPGQTVQLTALFTDSRGSLVPGALPVWEVADPRAGSLTPKGRFTAAKTPGSYPQAIRVKGPATGRDTALPVTVLLDVLIVEASQTTSPIILAVVPQAISVTPGQTVRFTVVALDRRDGRRQQTSNLSWRLLEPAAGSLSGDGQFRASERRGIYPGAVEASITLPSPAGGPGQELTALATVAILDPLPTGSRAGVLDRLAIFPEQVVLSPGESTRLIIVGLDRSGRPLANLDVRWSLDPEVGEVTPFVEVKAGKVPGVYRQAIRAVATVGSDGGVTSREVTADLVIRGPLATVSIEPATATVSPRGRLQLRAHALDSNGILLPDAFFRWEMLDKRAGAIDFDGTFLAGRELGEYPNAIQVTALQRGRDK